MILSFGSLNLNSQQSVLGSELTLKGVRASWLCGEEIKSICKRYKNDSPK